MKAAICRWRFFQFLSARPLLAAEEKPIGRPADALNVFDFERVARRNVPAGHFGSMATGVDDARPLRLIDVSRIGTAATIYGVKWPSPLFLCPCGSHKPQHPDGETAVARAARLREAPLILSTVAAASVEEVSREAGRAVWQQLHSTSRREVGERILRRAEAAGCPVLVITVDLPAGRNAETATRAIANDARNLRGVPSGGDV